MGRRKRHGNGGGRSLKQTLLRRVESLKEDNDDDAGRRSRKRRKENDEGEERLAPTSTSSDLDEASEMRNSETGTKAVPVPVAEEEKNIELDEGNTNKATSTMNLAGGGGDDSGGGEVVKWKERPPRIEDFGWMKEEFVKLKRNVIRPWRLLELLRHLGVKPTTGILLHGPPGCGKTRLAQAIANEIGLPFHRISPTELVSGVSGESEENIRKLFSEAKRTATSIVFIDEIDAIASKRENLQREMEKRIVTQLMTCMDQPNLVTNDSDKPPPYVLVIGATNRPDALDPALRRPGRFDNEILVGLPDESAREEILSMLVSGHKLDASFDLQKIARSTSGFVAADLVCLANKAGYQAFNRISDEWEQKPELSQYLTSDYTEDRWKELLERLSPEEKDKLAIKMSDLEEAVKMVQPSSSREGFSTIPDVKWEDVGGLDLLREEFKRDIINRIKYSEKYERLGVHLETGFLLYGPPGCGKTLIAKAVANEAGAKFIHIKGPELLNKYVGESERAVRTLFSRARTCAPCIIFFDEVDALTTNRGTEGGWVIERLLNQLLVELDGAEQRKNVFVIGATNRPEVMDRALVRPGRFGKLLYVPLPSADNRVMILKALARNRPVDASVDLSAIGRMEACENFSGADLNALMNQAARELASLDEELTSTETTYDTLTIKTSHFEAALSKVSPSVSDMQRQYYRRLSESLKAT